MRHASLCIVLVATVTATTLCLEPEAHAMGGGGNNHDSPSEGEAPPIEWGVHLNAGVGFGEAVQAYASGPAARVGLDAEYWLSKHWGVGAQIGLQGMTALNWGGSFNGQTTGSATVFSIAPAIALRGGNPQNFPIVSLALGYSLAHDDASTYCDPAYFGTPQGCSGGGRLSNDSGLYGSLAAGWLFHPWGIAMGPMFRLETFLGDTNGWSFFTGMQIGFGYAPHG